MQGASSPGGSRDQLVDLDTAFHGQALLDLAGGKVQGDPVLMAGVLQCIPLFAGGQLAEHQLLHVRIHCIAGDLGAVRGKHDIGILISRSRLWVRLEQRRVERTGAHIEHQNRAVGGFAGFFQIEVR